MAWRHIQEGNPVNAVHSSLLLSTPTLLLVDSIYFQELFNNFFLSKMFFYVQSWADKASNSQRVSLAALP